MNATIDPWVITQREKLKYQKLFEELSPQNGIVTGAQAKGFFLQSKLPPLTLGQIWALADTDSDGKMNINEFNIACKLINLKLRGFEIPKILPPTLIASLSSAAGTPILTPTGSLSPLDPLKSLGNSVTNIIPTSAPIATIKQQPQMTPLPQTIIPPIPGVPMIPPTAVHGRVVIPPLPGAIPPPNAVPGSVMPPPPGTIPPPNVMPGIIMPPPSGSIPPPVGALPIIPTQPLNSALDNAPPSLIPMTTQPIIPGVQPLVSVAPLIPPGQPLIPGQPPLISSVAAPQQSIVSSAALPTAINATEPVSASPVPPTPPQSNPPSRSVSISERGMPIESPQSEWAIKGPVKLKYTQLFNTTDRTRSGYLTGSQARNIMVQSKLPQAVLAQIWALADMDSDGRLGCEEFVLAMYLCDRALAGEKIPVTLPQDLIPPSFRKISSRHGSISGSRHTSQPGSRHASISSQGAIDADPAAGLPQTTFEDKRKENFDKGQAELDRRRKLLMEQQRKEQEERERKEREEAEKKEKARLEAERKQQEELERQLQHQREIEMEKEEQRKRALEAKEAARKELERQRQLEWEKQKIQEMQLQKEREQEKVLKLKARNQTLSIELSTINEKIKEMTQKIVDTRVGVSNVKSVIDGMRTTRDTKMTELAQHKSKIKEQNQKLLQLAQEKSKWDAKMKSGQDEKMNAAFTNKQIAIKQLKDKIENVKEEIETKKNDINSNDIQLEDLKIELSKLITKCEELYADYDTHRNQVLELKHNKKNESYNSTWDTAPSSNAWGDTTNDDAIESKIIPTAETVQDTQPAPEGFVKYRAIYEFSARNADEISFEPGDIILVPIEQNAEPGWLAGEINGHTGWFPETYVEKVDTSTAIAEDNVINTSNFNTQDTTYNDNKPLEETTETATEPTISSTINTEISKIDNATYNGDVEYYIAAYPYASTEIGDLNFNAGEMIMVTKKEGDWWTGTIGTKTGMFPSNYVQKADVGGGGGGTGVAVAVAVDTTTNIEETSYAQDTTIKDAVNGNAQEINETQIQLNETVTTQKYTADETKTQEDLDTEVSQINTQSQSKNTEQNQETSSRPMSRTSSMTPGMRARKSEIALVLAPYEAKSEEQLALQRGQLIMIRKKTDSGWWEGELQAKGQKRKIGWFPASYVKILQGGRNSGRNTPVSGSKIEMTEQIIDKVIALYPYKAQNDDELSFDKDDIISVLGRDEPEWWRGELNGLTGLFPSNYVGPFVSSGNV